MSAPSHGKLPGGANPVDAWVAARMGLARLEPSAASAWRMAELRRTLRWAVQASPFHAARLAGTDVNALQREEDLALLPRMTADDLAAPGLLTVSQDQVERVVSLPTSGTSGRPKRVFFSEADLLRTLEFFRAGMAVLCRAGDVALVLLPGRRPWGVADLLERALPGIGARAVAGPDPWRAEAVPGAVGREGAQVLVAAPSQLLALLALPREPFESVRAVLSSAEPLAPDLRRRVESAWGCEVFDHWGMTETGFGGGVECAAHSGYHLREADLLMEVADPATGAPLPEGRVGELLVTTLGPRAMPLLRYRTGDAGRWLAGPCPCGGALRRLDRVPGRLAPDGRSVLRPAKGAGSA